jgi:hypothetical protein
LIKIEFKGGIMEKNVAEIPVLDNIGRVVSTVARGVRRPGAIAALACGLLLVSLPAAHAIGPNNQVVPNPAPGATNTFSSVVGVVGIGGGTINTNGSGTVIDSYIDPATNVGYLCVLTADHNLPNANSIIFPNYTPGAAPPASGVYSIIDNQEVAGIGVGQKVDLNVVLVRYGTPNAFYFGVADKSLTTSVGVGNTLSEIGFGRQGIPGFTGANLTSLTEGNFASGGTMRYQNNLLTAFVANNPHNGYVENDITYTFDAGGTPNNIAGEGFGFRGDSGAPLFNNTTSFNPGMGLPLIAATDSIAGVDVFGPTGVITNGAVEDAVDVFDYRANIMAACADELASIPEPSSIALFAIGVCACLAARLYHSRRTRGESRGRRGRIGIRLS